MPHRNPQLVILGNPLGKSPEQAYERFHWGGHDAVLEVPRPDGVSADALVLIGEVQEIVYTTIDASERTKVAKLWTHKFEVPALLCTTAAGDVLIVLGGNLHVTPRGIEG
jgi:hypothetical protein